ncbi:TRAP transporter large permease [Enterovirga rhinocerotis]|uniref:TRAP transporter large permease protein n=1 Tax=Enterovirga rhinocerotis TaxID=1339210 RepID=A0A4R7BVD2_9HYPH|nr:TRAP transporter large permease [Enterovirga rhinocerotis]TDR88157.1 C4-dicarboxylate transporter DctM subunit [Enterovirga rhinocerotis]
MSTILVGGFFLFILMAVPIAFAMGLAIIFTIWWQGSLPMTLMAQRTLVGADSYALLAIPFFILAGNLMNVGGITTRIIDLAMAMVGRFRGGLALTSVTAAMIFSGLSGSAAADASALGKVLIPAMKRQGYHPGFAAALMASACVNGPIIPPSIPLVIYGLSAGKGVSIIALFIGGLIPGILLGIALMIAAYWISVKRNYPTTRKFALREIPGLAIPAIPALLMPVIILVGVTGGIVTVTESATVAVVYAFLVGIFVYRQLKLADLWPMLVQTALDTALVMFIIALSAGFAWLLAVSGTTAWLAQLIAGVSKDPLVILMLINVLLLIIGIFMEPLPAMLIMMPVLIPVVSAVGIDLVHFGLVMVFNLCLGLLTPPVGILLYICANFAGIKLEEEVKEIWPFFGAGLAVLFIITVFPQTVLWLPNLLLAP